MSVHSPRRPFAPATRRPIAPPGLDLATAYPTSTKLMPKLSETSLPDREKQQKPPRNCPKLHPRIARSPVKHWKSCPIRPVRKILRRQPVRSGLERTERNRTEPNKAEHLARQFPVTHWEFHRRGRKTRRPRTPTGGAGVAKFELGIRLRRERSSVSGNRSSVDGTRPLSVRPARILRRRLRRSPVLPAFPPYRPEMWPVPGVVASVPGTSRRLRRSRRS